MSEETPVAMPQQIPQGFTPPQPEQPNMWAPASAEPAQATPQAPSTMPSQAPAPMEAMGAFPAPAFGEPSNPFPQQALAFGTPGSTAEQPAAQNVAPSLGPVLFPSPKGQSAVGTSAEKEKRTSSRKRERKSNRDSPKGGKLSPVVIGLGAVAVLSAATAFLVPGIRNKIFGDSDPLPVSVDTVVPVPSSSTPATAGQASATPSPAASGVSEQTADSTVESTATAVSGSPVGLAPDPEAASKPAPDFGLGDDLPAPAPEALRATPAITETGTPAAAAEPDAESFQGDSTASPEDVTSARTILEKFINAQTIEERLSYSQPAPKIEEQMRDYYSKHPTPARLAQINYTLANVLEGSTKRFFIFEVTTDQQQQGFPVAVEETDDGLKVDWRSFVEFHDNMLGRFISVYRPGAESFRVILERAHYFKTDVPDLGGKLAFRIKPPIPGFEGFAFCSKDNTIGEELDRKFAWDVKYLPIVELEWMKDEKGAKYIKINRVIQDNWRAVQ